MRILVEQPKETRLDVFLSKQLPELSRSLIQQYIRQGHVQVNNQPAKPSQKVRLGQFVEVTFPKPKPSGLVPVPIPLSVLYEDTHCVAIDKPAHLVVHPGAGHTDATLVHALLYHYPDIHIGQTERPGIVHRLDKETSGVILIAKHLQAHHAFSELFKKRQISKKYRAFCVGTFKEPQWELRTGHARHKTHRKRFTTRLPPPSATNTWRLAHSRFEMVQSVGGISELVVFLLTGRTHQIRAHLADIQRPLAQDTLYGGISACKRLPQGPVKEAVMQLTRHALHAESLEFMHPFLGKHMCITAPLPKDLKNLHQALYNGSGLIGG